ncbi:hypothetical protein [Pedobacter cryophilus]|uniref:Restriction endonuclease n=1 Tax=Pedobacter cryophilus TaxID=2571271 RepID=A0A4U1BUJ0_9SPHI|nr:hypothetical protein [Pedobacter cryophilus]TKB95555.1 hypothetical protein FA046_16270 [Pedobacter cryophilus]
MNIKKILDKALDKNNFQNLQGYIDFAQHYLDFVSEHLQAVIISQNENYYNFYQYDKQGNFQITRPINSNLMYKTDTFSVANKKFIEMLINMRDVKPTLEIERQILNNATYTIQQSIGGALDAIEGGKSNFARKINGDLFENLIRLIINETGIKAKAGIVKVPVIIDNIEEFKMNYQHDLIIENLDEIKLIGSIKTSSKDRIDKIFIDKFLYNKLTEKDTPHIAIFLHDVQRKNARKENEYGVSGTFLPGHFKGYTIKLNPLDGVYYCDIRPSMKTEKILKDHIKTFDNLLIDDIWKFL